MNPVFWRFILNAFILPRRSQASAEKYQQIWTEQGSPLSVNMASLATKLEHALNAKVTEDTTEVPKDMPKPPTNMAKMENERNGSGTNQVSDSRMLVRHAMSYGSPSMEAALQELRDLGCEELCVIPLYPQSAFSTAKVVEDKLHGSLGALDWSPQLTFVENYHKYDAYLEAIAVSIRDAGLIGNDSLLMAFHSIPMKDVVAGDTYPSQVKATARSVAERLGLREDRWRVGFQCRFDNRKWVGPSTKKMLGELANNDGRLFVVAPNFSIDCLETIYDIETDLKAVYATMRDPAAVSPDNAQVQNCAAEDFIYVPCLNDSDEHVRLLTEIVDC